jgi:hypothetical protein
MAKNSITDYDNTAANNADVQSVDISEGCSPSGINNAIREVMADLADVNDGTVALTSPSVASLTLTGNANFGDNDKAQFGAGNDLQIFHDGSNSFIDDAGTGVLSIRSNSISLGKYTGENLASFVADGAATLYYDNAAKLATTSTGVSVTGGVTATNFIIPPAGGIIQTQYTQYTGSKTISLSANTDTALTDLTVNITPVSTSSKIHLQAHVFFEHGEDNDNSFNHVFFFYRDTTKLGHAQTGNRRCGISAGTRTFYDEDDNSTPQVARYDYFDEPNTTSQVTYKVGINVITAETFGLNQCVDDADYNFMERGISFISATEIAG